MKEQHKRKRKRMRQVTCFLPDDVLGFLDKEVERTGQSRSSVIRELLDFCSFPECRFGGKRYPERCEEGRLVRKAKPEPAEIPHHKPASKPKNRERFRSDLEKTGVADAPDGATYTGWGKSIRSIVTAGQSR